MRLHFGDCLFDSDTREVFRSGDLLSVSPKAFEFLEILIQRRPGAVSKDEIHRLLWRETFVSDANLPNLVAELRAAFGDSAHNSQIIRTVPRYGYAFCADATAEPGHRPSSSAVYRLIWGCREIALHAGENLLGRDEDAIVWIDDPEVSRRHARIVVTESGATLEDLGSKNGTFVRGERIRGVVSLKEGDLITIGPSSMILQVYRHTDPTASAEGEEAGKRTGS
jgi:DNA-binding winged helix-turn-helix (wHTH) protein